MIGGLREMSSPVVGGTNLGAAGAVVSGTGALPAGRWENAGMACLPAGLAGGIAGAGLGANLDGTAFAPILGAGFSGN